MAENKRAVGSVTYREAGDRLFRKAQIAPSCRLLVALGARCRRGHLRRLLRLEPRPRRRRLRRPADRRDRHHDHVLRPVLFSIAEMSPALPHTGGAYSFSRSAMGPWGGFITGLAENMEYVITPAVVVGAMGFLSHDIVFDLTGADGWWNSPVLWWAIFYIIFVGINILGIEITMRFTVVITVAALGVLAFFFVAVLVSRSVRRQPADQHPAGRGPEQLPATRHRGNLPRPTVRDLVLSRDRGTAAGRRGVPRSEARHPARDDLGPDHADVLRHPHPVPEHGCRRRRRERSERRRPRSSTGSRRSSARASVPSLLGIARADRSDRELLHDHLRLRAQHVFAVARRLFPAGSVDHPPDPQHAVRRAHRRRGDRVHPVAGHLFRSDRARARRGQDRRRAAVHGGVRRGDLVLHAVPGVHRAAPQAAEHRAAVPQPGGCRGCRDRGCDRAGCAGVAVLQRGLPAWCRTERWSTS